MIDEKFILNEENNLLINDKFAEKVYLSLNQYYVELGIDNAMKLIEYESMLNKLLDSKTIYSRKDNLLRVIHGSKKESIIKKAKNELLCIDMIKEEIKNLEGGENYC